MKILLAKLNHLGDTLLMTPTIRFLNERFPDAKIDVLVRGGCEEVLRGNPDVDRIFVVGRLKNNSFLRNARGMFLRRYDFAFDLSDSGRSKLWIALSVAKIRGINDAYHSVGWERILFNRISRFEWGHEHQVMRDFRTVGDVMKLTGEPGPLRFYPQVELGNWHHCLSLPGDYAVIHPASRWAFKQWLPERWSAVADALHCERGLQVVFSCGPADREKNLIHGILGNCKEKHSSTDGRLSLHELARLLQGAKIFLGVDTAVMHLAAATQTPTVALFGPSSEWSWHPWQCRHELALGPCNCKMTRQFVCNKLRPYPCMEAITVEMVREKISKLLVHG